MQSIIRGKLPVNLITKTKALESLSATHFTQKVSAYSKVDAANTKVMLSVLFTGEVPKGEAVDTDLLKQLDTIRTPRSTFLTSSGYPKSVVDTAVMLFFAHVARKADHDGGKLTGPEAIKNLLSHPAQFSASLKRYLLDHGIKPEYLTQIKPKYLEAIQSTGTGYIKFNNFLLDLHPTYGHLPLTKQGATDVVKNTALRETYGESLPHHKEEALKYFKDEVFAKLPTSDTPEARKSTILKISTLTKVFNQYQRQHQGADMTYKNALAMAEPIFKDLKITEPAEKLKFVKHVMTICVHQNNGQKWKYMLKVPLIGITVGAMILPLVGVALGALVLFGVIGTIAPPAAVALGIGAVTAATGIMTYARNNFKTDKDRLIRWSRGMNCGDSIHSSTASMDKLTGMLAEQSLKMNNTDDDNRSDSSEFSNKAEKDLVIQHHNSGESTAPSSDDLIESSFSAEELEEATHDINFSTPSSQQISQYIKKINDKSDKEARVASILQHVDVFLQHKEKTLEEFHKEYAEHKAV